MKSLNNTFIILIAIFSLLFSGCGAIMHGSKQDISVNSSPSDATVKILGESRSTPAVFNLKRKHSYIVKISKQGYEPAEVMINNKLDWTAWADIFLWGVLPVFYDLATGSAYKLSPEEINVNLTRSLGNLEGPETVPICLEMDDNELSINGADQLEIEIIQVD